MALARVKIMREYIGEDAPSLLNVTREHLEMSSILRKTILEYNSIHFLASKTPQHSFTREYENEREEKISLD
jgi:hypothetical protein